MRTRQPTAALAPAARFDSLEQEVFLNLWRTYDRLRQLEDDLFLQFDLTPQQYNALRLLRAAHPDAVPTLELGARLVSRAPDITRLLDKLADRGWIARERPADNRRVVQVAITPAGIELLERIAEPLQECHARQLGHLSAAELKQLVALLRTARAPHESDDGPWS
ncbi:MAG: MarR family transcriptional regulator [Pirellulales bacterium]